MKRWQDRGVVLDSDDEDESQSQERTPKRARVVGVEEDTVLLQEEENVSIKGGPKHNVKESQEGGQRLEIVHESSESGVADEEAGFRIDASLEPSTERDHDHFGAKDEGYSVHLSRNTPSEGSEAIPKIRDILDSANNAARQQATTASTATSSPLSDCELSPPAPAATFRFPRLGLASDNGAAFEQEDGEDPIEPSLQGATSEEVSSALRGRRTLRARKEKQLHPYLFDKAQHQKQFQERGMRPIRYEPVRREAETQDALLSGDEESAQSSVEEYQTHNEPSSELGTDSFLRHAQLDNRAVSRAHDVSSDEEELPERPLFRRSSQVPATYSNKRRKLVHPSRLGGSTSIHQSDSTHLATQNENSVPPSPPPTSSGSITHAVPTAVFGQFRMPRGLTPDPLPTPQISSELRDRMPSDVRNDSDPGSQEPQSRPSTMSRQPIAKALVASSSESSEAEPDAQIVGRRLKRERKRIKGVLPASWLKIDFRAQQKQVSPSPRRTRRDSSPSPVRTLPQKGVAQRIVSKATASPSRRDAIIISDDEGEDSRSPGSPLLSLLRQSRLDLEREHTTTVASELLDDEDMEGDWIDPMFVGSSRPRLTAGRGNKRQPRITERFSHRRNPGLDFSEERRSKQSVKGATSRSTNPGTRPARPNRRKWPAAPRLSILDAPAQVNSAVQDMPQFLRVAVRRARTQSDRGRHSPTHKHIRLATRDDTEEARSVLRSWREGTILPHRTSRMLSANDSPVAELSASDEEDQQEHRLAARTPLAEIQNNTRRQPPLPLRKQTTERDKAPRVPRSSRTSKLRQTQLQPITIPNEGEDENHDAGFNNFQTPPTTKARRDQNRLRVDNRPVRYRTAQLETLEDNLASEHRAAAFQRRIYCLTEHVARSHREIGKDVQLNRFLNNDTPIRARDRRPHDNGSTFNTISDEVDSSTAKPRTKWARRPRKHQACRIDAETREYRQPSEPLPALIISERIEDDTATATGPALQELGPFGSRYATDFDILPLPLDTYFHESSFIGGGDFAASLNFANRDLDIASGHIRVHIQDDVLEWGAWTEDVASGLGRIPNAVTDILRSLDSPESSVPDEETLSLVLANVDYLLRSTVRYFMWCVSFLDPVDRRQCINSLDRLIEGLLEAVAEHESKGINADNALSRCLQYVMILSRQHLELCDHALVSSETAAHARETLLGAASRLAAHMFPSAFQELRNFYEENHRGAKRESGIHDTDTAICSIVILYHATQNPRTTPDRFWSMFQRKLAANYTSINTVRGLDQAWYNLFTILPVLEVDSRGLLQPGSRFQNSREDWTVPKTLLRRLFELYHGTSCVYGSTINEYLRSTLIRCSYLITRWGWWKCESLLGTVFDFFAQRGLKQLHNEELRGSPGFLDELFREPSFEVQREDRAFHIFLKMLASALQGMRKYGVYPDKKIGGIAWRFIPNHGRTYRKDSELLQEDLNALRNHHDLLCVLYYSAPPNRRINVNVIQNLVDHCVSHREACRLNIRAWQRLASFQASVDEGEERLEELCVWFSDMMTTTMNQYRLARNEIEHELASVHAHENPQPSRTVIEDVIARNQRQIAATLIDIIGALKCALKASRNLANARYLLNGSAFWHIFDLCQPSERRLHGMLHEALDIARVVLSLQSTLRPNVESQQRSDDSQDYGDSSALEQLVSTRISDDNITDLLHEPFGLLISNIFGADTTTDDRLLTEIVDVWVKLAQTRVQDGLRTWPSYITGYHGDAWIQLRDTEQKRKYTPYVLSRILEQGNVDLAESGILTSWLSSLVEREAKLKFQHTLTTALLTRSPQEALLSNLPFKCHRQGRYDVSLQELRQRRLALVSSVLSNMRECRIESMRLHPSGDRQLRQTYALMLKQLMQSMKDNYQDLQASRRAEIADVQAEGAYVFFVQQVVSFLQEYTTDIYPVDRFFTDSPAFPLPANDPTYVVGRVRSYAPKLNESGKRRELATFIQNVGERAIIDGKEAYLIDQLVTATVATSEHDNPRASNLRQVLCSAIFPAYIESALTTECSWIIAIPILETCEKVAEQLLYHMKAEEHESVRAVVETIAILLRSATRPAYAALTQSARIALPNVQRLLRAVFNFARSCLTCSQYFDSIQPADSFLSSIATSFYGYAASIEAFLLNKNLGEAIADLPTESGVVSPWSDTLQAVRKQVRESLTKNWFITEGQYYLKKGDNSVEVFPHVDHEEKSQLLSSLAEFQKSYETIFEGQGRSRLRRNASCNIDAVVV